MHAMTDVELMTDLQNSIASLQRQIFELKRKQAERLEEIDKQLPRLTKEEIIAKAMELPSIPMHLIDWLEEQGFRTGSSMLATGEPNDYDYVINAPPQTFKGYILGSSLDYFNENRFVTGYGHVGSQLYNIIFMSDYTLFRAWKYTTEMMFNMRGHVFDSEFHRPMPMQEALDNKYCRVRIFRALVDALDTTMAPDKTVPSSLAISREDAIRFRRCRTCGREAINFTVDKFYKHYLETGVCERCVTKV